MEVVLHAALACPSEASPVLCIIPLQEANQTLFPSRTPHKLSDDSECPASPWVTTKHV